MMERPAKRSRKNQTQACITCKSRHQRCLGGPPCAYCLHRGIKCEFQSQAKRGPKNLYLLTEGDENNEDKEDNSKEEEEEVPSLVVSANTTEIVLWHENERIKTVDSFFNMRGWHTFFLDRDQLQNGKTHTSQVQLLAIGAFISRYNNNQKRATEFYKLAHQLAMNLPVEQDIEAGCSLMLLFDYMPAQAITFLENAWNRVKDLSTDNPRTRRIYLYIYFMHLIYNNLSAGTKINYVNYLEEFCARTNDANLWDITFALIVRVYKLIFKNNGYTDSRFLDALKQVELTEHEIERAIRDLNMTLWIIRTNLNVFGHELRFFVEAMKTLVLWKKDRDVGMSEAVKYICEMRSVGPLRVFLVDLLTYSIPLLVLHEEGMTNMLKEGLDLISPVAFATEQYALYSSIFSYFFPPSTTIAIENSFPTHPFSPLPISYVNSSSSSCNLYLPPLPSSSPSLSSHSPSSSSSPSLSTIPFSILPPSPSSLIPSSPSSDSSIFSSELFDSIANNFVIPNHHSSSFDNISNHDSNFPHLPNLHEMPNFPLNSFFSNLSSLLFEHPSPTVLHDTQDSHE